MKTFLILTMFVFCLTFSSIGQQCQYNFGDHSIIHSQGFENVFKEIDDVSCFDITFKISAYKQPFLLQSLMVIMDKSDFVQNYMQLAINDDEIFVWNQGVTEYMFMATTVDANLQLDQWYRVQWTTDKEQTVIFLDGVKQVLYYSNQYSPHKWVHNLASFNANDIFELPHNVDYFSLGAWESSLFPGVFHDQFTGSIRSFKIVNQGPPGVKQIDGVGVSGGKRIMDCPINYKFNEGEGNILNDCKLNFNLNIEGNGNWSCN